MEQRSEKGTFISPFLRYFPLVDLHFLSLENCGVLVFCLNIRGGKLFDVFIERFSCILQLALNAFTVTYFFKLTPCRKIGFYILRRTEPTVEVLIL